jgi:protein subunit release factor A
MITPTTNLDGLMVGISLNIRPTLLEQIDAAKGAESRSGYIAKILYEYLNTDITQSNATISQLTQELNAAKETQRYIENEVDFLRSQNKQLTDALSQHLLPAEPKKHWWSRRKKE